MIDVKPTLIACAFESAGLSATFADYQVDKSYDALDFSKD